MAMGLFQILKEAFTAVPTFDDLNDEFYDGLEEALILADVGADTAADTVAQLRKRVKERFIGRMDEVKDALRDILKSKLEVGDSALVLEGKPTVVLVIGVNGVGCTFRMAKYSAMATNAFSPPDSSVMVFSCLPGGCTLISMPQLRISLSSSSSSRALPPPNSSKNVSWKLSFSSWNCSAKMLVICWVIWSIMPSSSSLACSTSLRCSDR